TDPGETIPIGSSIGRAMFQIKKGVFSERAYIIGKVFVDDNDNRVQDNGEVGVEGVKIYMEDGRYIVTDSEGKYHMDGVDPGPHMVKVDTMSLPPGTKLAQTNSRNLGDPGSVFADIFAGDIFKASFRVIPSAASVEVTKETEAARGRIVTNRIIESVFSDPSVGTITLKHNLTIRNDAEFPVYEFSYTESSPFMPLKGTAYLAGAPLKDPERRDGSFSWLFPVLEAGEEIKIIYSSNLPSADSSGVGRIEFMTSPGGTAISEEVPVPVIFTASGDGTYEVSVYFEEGRRNLSWESKRSLDKIIETLRKNEHKKVLVKVKGDYNSSLAYKRSSSVKDYLADNLLDMKKVVIVGDKPGGKGGSGVKEKRDAKFTLLVGRSWNKDQILRRADKLKEKGINTFVSGDDDGEENQSYKLYAGKFTSKDEARKYSQGKLGRDYAVVPFDTSGGKGKPTDNRAIVYYKGDLAPHVVSHSDLEMGSRERHVGRNAEIKYLPFLATARADKEIKYADLIKKKKYKVRVTSENLYPTRELYGFTLYLKLPKGVNYINSTATVNGKSVDVGKNKGFYTIVIDKVDTAGPFALEMSVFIVSASEKESKGRGAVHYAAFAKTKKGKVITLLDSGGIRAEAEGEYLKGGAAKSTGKAKKKTVYGIIYPEKDLVQTLKSTDLVVTVPLGSGVALKVNDRVVSAKKIGEKSVDKKRKIVTIRYEAVSLEEGENIITLLVNGIRAPERRITITGEPVELGFRVVPERPEADGKTPAYVILELLDDKGAVVHQNAHIEVSVDKGDIFDDSDGKYKSTAGDEFKVKVTSGKGVVKLSPAARSGKRVVTVTYGKIELEVPVRFYPEKRPWIILGDIETGGAISERSKNSSKLVDEPFDHNGKSFKVNGGLFAKGTIKDYTVTMRYKEKHGDKSRLLEDNRIDGERDELYPIYGDSSEQFFEAQSQTSYFFKAEKNLNHFLVGDYKTAFGSSMTYNKYDRVLNGALINVESEDNYKVRTFVSENSQVFARDELKGMGLSGPYKLSKSLVIENSEKVWIEVRDRFNENLIIETRQLSRNSEYSINYDSGYLVFKEPVPEFTSGFDPIYINVLYETNGGMDNLIYGGRAEKELFDGMFRVGVSGVMEEDTIKDKTFTGGDFIFNARSVTVTGELTHSRNYDSGTFATTSGHAKRIEGVYKSANRMATVFYKQNADGYQNLSAVTAMKAYETYGAAGSISLLSGGITLGVKVDHVKNGMERDTAEARIDHALLKNVKGTFAVRTTRETTMMGEKLDYTQGIAGLQFKPIDKVSIHVKREENLTGDDKSTIYPTRTSAGVTYAFSDWANLFAETEYQERFDGDISLTSFGVNSKIGENTTAFSKYTMDDSTAGGRNQTHMGVNHVFIISDVLTIDLGGENVKTVSGASPASDYTVLRIGGTYLKNKNYKITGRYEWKLGKERTDSFATIGASVKFRDAYTIFGNASYMQSTEEMTTITLGIARRPVYDDRLNLVAKLRYKINSGGAVDDTQKLLFSTHAVYSPTHNFDVMGEYAAKFTRVDGVGSSFTDLVRGHAVLGIGDRVDFNVHGGVMRQHNTNTYTGAYGVEAGVRAYTNLWLSAGYNFAGFYDNDFDNASYWAKGPYFKLRFKFDENSVKKVYSKLDGEPEKKGFNKFEVTRVEVEEL
ncbi:MAG: SdrD B-like domain-containing protein, partial [Thermodesulfobacteriota bacterium]